MRTELTTFGAIGLVVALGLPGCGGQKADPISADQVITLEACGPVDPEGADPEADPILGPCARVADGVSEVSVRVCVPVEERKKDLTAVLSVSEGYWRVAEGEGDGRTIEVALGEIGCDERSFVTATAVQPAVLVRAELLGFAANLWVQLTPAAIAELVLAAEPATFEPNAQVRITAGLHAEGAGQISDGTEVAFEIIAIDPVDASAFIHPTRTEVEAGQAVSILSVGASAQSITVRATAVPPVIEGVAGPDPVSQELVLNLREP